MHSAFLHKLFGSAISISDFAAALQFCDISLTGNPVMRENVLARLSQIAFKDYKFIAPGLNRFCRINQYDSEVASIAVYVNWVNCEYDIADQIAVKSVARYGLTKDLLRNLIFLYLVSGDQSKLEWALKEADEANLNTKHWRNFISDLRKGEVVSVKHPNRNESFLFFLSCYSSQAMETAFNHYQGRFCEERELDLISKLCRDLRILEIGSLVGNHTVFMLISGNAKHVTAVDIDSRSCFATKLNASINGIDSSRLAILHAKAGAPVNYLNNEDQIMKTFCLTHDIDSVFDFIKIDIDGGEIEFFDASMSYLDRYSPMIFSEVQLDNVAPARRLLNSLGYQDIVVECRQNGEQNMLFYTSRHKSLLSSYSLLK